MSTILKPLVADIKAMTVIDHLIYWILPTLILGVLMVFYFSGNSTLVEIVSPTENREWGLLENLQLVIILAILGVSIYGIRKKNEKILKWVFFFIALLSIFIFLEEIDYGKHFAQLTSGEKREFLDKYIPAKNIHNQGDNARIFKRIVYYFMALAFLVAPFLKTKLKYPLLEFLIPRPRILIIAFVAMIIDRTPRFIVAYDIRKDGGLGINIGEFSEVMVYYIFLIYVIQLVFYNTYNRVSVTKTV